MDILTSFIIISLSGLIHASFHLSISALTLLSGHSLSKKHSHLKLVKLSSAFTLGVIISTIFLFCTFAFYFETLYSFEISHIIWGVLIGLSVGSAISVWGFYYKRNSKNQSGTEMWIPRGFAKFLNNRSSKTKHSAEAFSLGVTSIISEILFIFTPITAAVLSSMNLTPSWQFVAITLYTTLANLPIFIVFCLISGGHPIGKIQIWRENNKRFLQFASGVGLLALAVIIFINIFGVNL